MINEFVKIVHNLVNENVDNTRKCCIVVINEDLFEKMETSLINDYYVEKHYIDDIYDIEHCDAELGIIFNQVLNWNCYDKPLLIATDDDTISELADLPYELTENIAFIANFYNGTVNTF